MFETFQPTRTKTIQREKDGLKQAGNSTARSSSLLDFLDDLGLPSTEDGDGFQLKLTPLSSSTRDVSFQELRRMRALVFNGLNVEANFDLNDYLEYTRQAARQQESAKQYLFSPFCQLCTNPFSIPSSTIGRHDLMWANATSVNDDLKKKLTLWQESLFDAVDRLVDDEIKEFYVMGSSAFDASGRAESAFAPTCMFSRSATSAQVLLFHCNQYIIKRLAQLGVECRRVVDGFAGASGAALSTSSKGAFQVLRGNNHILVEGELGLSTVCHIIVDEVAAFIHKEKTCTFIPPLLSPSPLLHGGPDVLQWSAAACRAAAPDASDTLLPPLIRSLLATDGEDAVTEAVTKLPLFVAREDTALRHKARLDCLVTVQQVVGIIESLALCAQRRDNQRPVAPPLLMSHGGLQERRVRPRLAVPAPEDGPTGAGTPQSRLHNEEQSALIASQSLLLASSGGLLNPMVIVTGQKRQASTAILPSPPRPAASTAADEGLWFVVQCKGWSSRLGILMASIPCVASAEDQISSDRSAVEVVSEIKWSSKAPRRVSITFDKKSVPTVVTLGGELSLAAQAASEAVELAPIKPYSAFVDSVW